MFDFRVFILITSTSGSRIRISASSLRSRCVQIGFILPFTDRDRIISLITSAVFFFLPLSLSLSLSVARARYSVPYLHRALIDLVKYSTRYIKLDGNSPITFGSVAMDRAVVFCVDVGRHFLFNEHRALPGSV